MNNEKNKIIAFSLLAATGLVFGCGEGNTNPPSVKLTASEISSQADTTAHVHMVSIPFTDISASPVADTYQYRSGTSNNHSHVIALSRQQVIDLNNGMRLTLTSSLPDSGANHTHTWIVQGGDLLYDKNCYNCHSNDKRGHNPMNVSFINSQITAVINPGGAPLSTTPAAIPNPDYMASTVVSLDGASLYAANCASCHGAVTISSKQNKTFSQIKNAISINSGGMASLGVLTDAQIQAIATALVK